MKALLRSFEPVASDSARILILGSMPGERSLTLNQYYGHPRNAFWAVMQELTGVSHAASYEERLQGLKSHGIALWDVLHSCHRKGSLDAAIDSGSIRVNDFSAFFLRHPHIRFVLFNGATAEHYYRRYVLPDLSPEAIEYIRLPSTSPAHAALAPEQKVMAWRNAIAAIDVAASR